MGISDIDFEVTDGILHDIVKIIVREIAPESIYLFGSRARNEQMPQSDVDILIVKSEPFSANHSRKKDSAKLRRALRNFYVPLDILIHSKDEVAEWKDSVNHVIGRALCDGRMLYERH